ncbi:MAG: zinc-ribbon domain-containing protein, partial [Syntrophobacterales bacterium]|nr:zinc-ribbon domain-containing protein [Syntrophobacterales bacterium]
MIIQCKKCGTKYRFDKSQIDGEGIWVRCSHCKTVFFQENPLAGSASLTGSIEPGGEIHEKAAEAAAEEINRIFMEVEGEDGERESEYEEVHFGANKAIGETNEGDAEDIDVLREDEVKDDAQDGQEEVYGDAGEIIDDAEASKEAQKPRSPGKRIAIFLMLVILLSGGIYLWTSPRAIEGILNRVLPRVEKFTGALPGAEKFLGTKSRNIPNECLSGLGV